MKTGGPYRVGDPLCAETVFDFRTRSHATPTRPFSLWTSFSSHSAPTATSKFFPKFLRTRVLVDPRRRLLGKFEGPFNENQPGYKVCWGGAWNHSKTRRSRDVFDADHQTASDRGSRQSCQHRCLHSHVDAPALLEPRSITRVS